MKTAPRKEKEKRGDGNELLGARVSFFLKPDFFSFLLRAGVYSPEPGARGARRAALAEHVACGMWHVARGARSDPIFSLNYSRAELGKVGSREDVYLAYRPLQLLG